jgi:hypothetical protein
MATPAPRSFSPRSASDPVHAWVSDADGRRCSTDDTHHRLLIESEGHTTIVGRAGTGVAEFQYPQFFRLAAHPVLRGPVHLRWQAPLLEIECSNGRGVRVDLAAAMLPAFGEWLRTAPAAERARARRYFSMTRTRRRAVPDFVWRALASETAEG